MAEELSPLENHLWWMEQLRKDAKAKQPEALRLADQLGARYRGFPSCDEAAAELRRLHKEIGDWDRVCDQHLKHIDTLKKRMKRAEALNQELLGALKRIYNYQGDIGSPPLKSAAEIMRDKARAALVKATKEQA